MNDLFKEMIPEGDGLPLARPWVVFDTETSGLFDFSKPADAPGQPRLAALSMISTTPTLAITHEKAFFVRPDGWTIDAGASAVNGLTHEFLMDVGVPVGDALDYYEAAIKDGCVFAAYNSQFDTKVMRAEFRRAGRPDHFEDTPNVCVMRKSIGVCKIPKKTGNGYKFPKLSEACAHFKIKQAAAHTALDDARAALGILRMLYAIGIDVTPEVHKAKNRPTDEPGT